MRVRIVLKPPAQYSNGIDVEALAVGRVYNLAASLASALMLDGYAELYEGLSVEEKRERVGEAAHMPWLAADHAQQWDVTPKKLAKPPKKKKQG